MRRLLLALLLVALGCSAKVVPTVVVYCPVDQVYSEPVLQDYQRRTGVQVLARYDVEATKTSGLINLLLAERDRPKCDVLWNNEMLQTEMLRQEGLLEPYRSANAEGIPAEWKDPEGAWTGFAARLRVIVYHRDKVGGKPPRGLDDLADPRWKGQAAFSRPLFGTALTHMACLHQSLGAEAYGRLLDGMQANEVQILDGNSVVKDRVAAGDLAWGWTDSDDANVAKLAGAPVEIVVPEGTLVIPNTVAVIRGGPHPEEARRLVDYLLSAEVEQRMADCDSKQIPMHGGGQLPAGAVRVDLRKAAAGFRPVLDDLRARFVR